MAQSGFLKSVLTLLSGSVAAQSILLLSNLLMARWYSPEVLGEFRVFGPVVFISALLACGGYELAIMLPKKDRDAYALVRLSSKILLTCLLLLTPIAFLLRFWLADVFNAPSLSFWALFWPLSIFMEGAFNLMHQFLVRKKRYKNASITFLSYALVYAAIALIGSQIRLSVHIFFIAWLSAQLVKVSLYWWFYQKQKREDASLFQEPATPQLAQKYWQYPVFHLGSSFTNTASKESVAPMLSAFYGSATAGLYGLAYQVLFLPMRFLSQSVTTVFYQRVAKARDMGPKHVKRETLNTVFFLLLVSTLPTFFLTFFGADLFALLFGEEWRDAAVFIKWLAAFAVVSSVASPLTSLVNVKFKLASFFAFNLLLLVSRLGAVALGAYWGQGAEVSIQLYGLAAFLGALVLIVWMLQLAGIFKKEPSA